MCFKSLLNTTWKVCLEDFFKRKRIRKEKDKQLLISFLGKIKKEKANFDRLDRGVKDYSSSLHEKAVEVYSYEKSEEALLEIFNVRRYKRLNKHFLKAIKNKDSKKILELIKIYEKKISKLR